MLLLFLNQILFKIKTMFQTAENNQQHFKSLGFPASLCKNFSKGPWRISEFRLWLKPYGCIDFYLDVPPR